MISTRRKYTWNASGIGSGRGAALQALMIIAQARGLAVLDTVQSKIFVYPYPWPNASSHFSDYAVCDPVGSSPMYGRWEPHGSGILDNIGYLFEPSVPTHAGNYLIKRMIEDGLARYVAADAHHHAVALKATLPTSLPNPEQTITLSPVPPRTLHPRPPRLPFE